MPIGTPEPEDQPPKGRITTEHTCWCWSILQTEGGLCDGQVGDAACCQHHQSSEPRLADIMRRGGWKLTRRYGWLCPPCSRAADAAGTED